MFTVLALSAGILAIQDFTVLGFESRRSAFTPISVKMCLLVHENAYVCVSLPACLRVPLCLCAIMLVHPGVLVLVCLRNGSPFVRFFVNLSQSKTRESLHIRK